MLEILRKWKNLRKFLELKYLGLNVQLFLSLFDSFLTFSFKKVAEKASDTLAIHFHFDAWLLSWKIKVSEVELRLYVEPKHEVFCLI